MSDPTSPAPRQRVGAFSATLRRTAQSLDSPTAEAKIMLVFASINLCLYGGLGWWLGSLGIDGFVDVEAA
eukprot:s1517_g14.t1